MLLHEVEQIKQHCPHTAVLFVAVVPAVIVTITSPVFENTTTIGAAKLGHIARYT